MTYTDVHSERLQFFQEMLKPRGVQWQNERAALLAAGAPFYLATGTLNAADAKSCRAYLDFLGSRLVFLIDWNRARKQLRSFLRGADRLALLRWAAGEDIGHRGFLELGGAMLVNEAIEATAGTSMHFGDRLCDVLGDAETLEFLRFTFRAATEGLLAGQSQGFIRDRMHVALATHFTNEERQLLRMAADHAGLIFELANLVRDGLQGDAGGRRQARAARGALRARCGSARRGDARAVRAGRTIEVFRTLLEAADDAADALEDAAFLLDLDALEGKPLAAIAGLAELLVEASQEWIKASAMRADRPRRSREETEDFLAAIDRIAALEHQADDVERALTADAVRHARDFRQLQCSRRSARGWRRRPTRSGTPA